MPRKIIELEVLPVSVEDLIAASQIGKVAIQWTTPNNLGWKVMQARVTDAVELVPHGELVALKERDAARADLHTLREHHDLYVSQVGETIAGLHAENLRLHDLLAQRPAAFVDPDRKLEHNPFRDHADDPRRIGSRRGLM